MYWSLTLNISSYSSGGNHCVLYCACRSGKYTYKPTMSKTCCPMYPIRCAVANLRLTKSQKKVIKQVNQYLSYDQRHTKEASTAQCDDDRGHSFETFTSGSKDAKRRITAAETSHDETAVDELSVKSKSTEATRNLPKPGGNFFHSLTCCYCA